MRENICKRGTRSDEVKTQTKEVPPLKLVRDSDDLNSWIGDFTDTTPTCPYCNKKFERKAVLASHVQSCGTKESNSRRSTSTPKPVKVKVEVIDENSSNSSDISRISVTKNVSKIIDQDKLLETLNGTIEGAKRVNKRKRKGPLVIRNESPEIKDEADVYWADAGPARNSSIFDEAKIKTENDATDHDEMVIEEPPKKRKLKKEQEETDVIKNIPCALCSKKFATNTNLKRHVAMFHFRQNRFACKLCEFRGYRRVDTITHLGNAHNIHGEKEEVNKYIEITIKDDDLRGPINTDEKCDPNLTFSSVVASILSSSSETANSIASKSVGKPSGSSQKRGRTKAVIKSQNESSSKIPKDESGGSGMSSPTSEQNLDSSDSKRPTRNRIKPVCKDFVYDLNKIIKQEAEVHREQQQQQSLLPARNQRRRNTTTTAESPPKESPKIETEINDKENIVAQKSDEINEIAGAALKMAKIEVMNQRASFHKLPEIPSAVTFVPTKISTPRRSDGKVIKNVSTIAKEPGKRGRKREVKRTPSFTDTFLSTASSREIKRTPSFTDTFLSNTGSAEKFKTRESGTDNLDNQPNSFVSNLADFPSSSLKAIKKQELSSKEKTQLEMLQKFRDEKNLSCVSDPGISTLPTNLDASPSTGKRISVLQRLAENKRKSQEFFPKPNIDDD